MDETVKLIVKIPKEDYLAFSELSEKEKVNELSYYERIIANGVPLDSVKAEIDKLTPWIYKSEVFGILDDIGKESEGKPNE